MSLAIKLVIELGRDSIPNNIVTKVSGHWVKMVRVREWTKSIFEQFHQLGCHNSQVSGTIRLIIELGRDIMLINIVTKNGDVWIRMVQIIEQTK